MSKRGSLYVGNSSRSIGSSAGGPAHKLFNEVATGSRGKDHSRPFTVDSTELGVLSEGRTRSDLADILQSYLDASGRGGGGGDVEDPSSSTRVAGYIQSLVQKLNADGTGRGVESDDHTAELAALALTTILLRSSPEHGISRAETDLHHRTEAFGANTIAEKPTVPFWMLCWEALQDFVLLLLLVFGVVTIVLETTTGGGHVPKEGIAILLAVAIVVLITAAIDQSKQVAFKRLSKNLDESNTKSVVRDGDVVMVTDAEIVVGDVLLVNSHSMASIPADCVLLGPTMDLKMDESTLTGESVPVAKKAGDVVLAGTNAVEGSGKMVVVAVGIKSVGGKIRARVYESTELDDDGEEDLEGDSNSPLFDKIESIAKFIGYVGTVAALFGLIFLCIRGFAFEGRPAKKLLDYFLLGITILAVAVPEGLPLAVTLSLAFSSFKMAKEQNLVKNLKGCETMGCATTICTDKTGTLTTNRMTARAIYTQDTNIICEDPATTLGAAITKNPQNLDTTLLTSLISICTMNETVLTTEGGKATGSSGNPTEVALLQLVHELGQNYNSVRDATRGRSDVGELSQYLHEGKQFNFSSARKMMSWAVPLGGGGYRIYTKGASEVILGRCSTSVAADGSTRRISDEKMLSGVGEQYARRGMRCLGLAYRDLPNGTDFGVLSSSVQNSDGSQALEAETDLTFAALVGIEDPLRIEVPAAIEACYKAGIDVRLVTGDSPNTAVSIAYQAGILRESHFTGTEKVATNLKSNVLMEGQDFRDKVYDIVDGKKIFNQTSFDLIWPHLRVLARSSPDDKLTLAHGLNQSTLYTQKDVCARLLEEHDIKIFPDRQVIAMTGDGTNDAPALKRADIGFAMGLTGTQIAKDASDIILLDDNFASIVTAAKWGRNVYASIQKFLQFQLTVNISAVGTTLVGCCYYTASPLQPIHLLWVNLLMDALASLALATEPPAPELLNRSPVNRSDSMVTRRMWANMLGQAAYQCAVLLVLLFSGPSWFDLEPGNELAENDIVSVHYTFIFNAFVWMQLFNEVNCRNLKGEVNVFRGIEKNYVFLGILFSTSVLQVIIVQFGGEALQCADGGLDAKYWGYSIGIGAFSLVVQQIINVLFTYSSRYKTFRKKKRLLRDRRSLN